MSRKEIVIHERLSAGQMRRIRVASESVEVLREDTSMKGTLQQGRPYFVDLLTRMFLPVGYPSSVSPDYLRYQILNALQAFCNSLASLISSRAILQGFGVGDPTASPTKALLLTVLQDVFSRLTTILSAHIIGSSLSPEAKTFRLLADVLNDTAVILDTLSPAFNSLPIPGLRVGSLCLSAVFRSLCGIAAGGSKAAITIHFASPLDGKGDIGDLNAKDSSKETVLALFGMLLGTLIVPYLTTTWTTYSALFLLVGLHLAINYFGVRGLTLRTLNRQRLGIAWIFYAQSHSSIVPTPLQTADMERILDRSDNIRDFATGRLLGQCTIGSSFSENLRGCTPPGLLDLFNDEHYVIWFDHACLRQPHGMNESTSLHGLKRVHIFLKEGYVNVDLVKAWTHATDIFCAIGRRTPRGGNGEDPDAMDAIRTSYDNVRKHFAHFQTSLRAAGWETVDCPIMAGLPDAVMTAVATQVDSEKTEDKKTR